MQIKGNLGVKRYKVKQKQQYKVGYEIEAKNFSHKLHKILF